MKKPIIAVAAYYLICVHIVSIQAAFPFHTAVHNAKYTRQNSVCANHVAGEFVSNPADCALFFLCMENGQAVLAACPPTMLFNSESKLCDTAANVKCNTGIENVIEIPANNNNGNGNSNGNGNENANIGDNNINKDELADATNYCATLPAQPTSNRIAYVGSSNNCERYYICYYGQAILQECSANLHWNANIEKCDLPVNAGCSLALSNNTNTENNDGSDVDSLWENNTPNGAYVPGSEFINCPRYGQHIFPHIERCAFFIYCVKGHATVQLCPFYFHFDVVTRKCKWRTAAICVRDLNISARKLL